ncbi:hypothetical protein K490DRAFT_43841, partial [Saccharata proteae CBS 121410]
ALLAGGVTPETLQVLLTGEDVETDDKEHKATRANYARNADARRSASSDHANGTSGSGHHSQAMPPPSRRVSSFGIPDTPSYDSPQHRQTIPQYDKRTLLITNLSDRTTHGDIANIIRGGRVLEIFLRKNERVAQVSLAEGAQSFLDYASKNDIYVNTKRASIDILQVEIRWNDKQFFVPNHVANKLNNGATRNIVVRGGAAKLNEQTVRDDMEHIHNLVVISVKIVKNDVFISTNSVHNALYARTCMMSRAFYKGFRIEWYPDECAAPLPHLRQRLSTPSLATGLALLKPQPKPPKPGNMYAVLDPDTTEDDESEVDGSEADASAFGGHGVGVSDWADGRIAV